MSLGSSSYSVVVLLNYSTGQLWPKFECGLSLVRVSGPISLPSKLFGGPSDELRWVLEFEE